MAGNNKNYVVSLELSLLTVADMVDQPTAILARTTGGIIQQIGVDSRPRAGSKNLITSGGLFALLNQPANSVPFGMFDATHSGIVPASGGGTTKFLRADGSWATIAGGGSVTTVSVVSANGFAGTVATATTTPAITISTTVTGILKGNGTAISAAVSGTDYLAPTAAWLTASGGALTADNSVTGAFNLGFTLNSVTVTQNALSSTGGLRAFTVVGGPHTNLTTGVESIDVNFNLARTVQFATGAIANQRAVLFSAPTYAFFGASTITTGATVAISGNPVLGTNATITNPASLWVQSGGVLIGTSTYFLNAGNDIMDLRKDQNNTSVVIVGNATSGTIANAGVGVTCSATAATSVFLRTFSAGFTTTGITIANTAALQSSMTNGLQVGTTNGAPLSFFTNNTSRQAIDTNGLQTYTQSAQVVSNTFITFTQATHTGGTAKGFLWTAGPHTGQATGVEVTDINFNLARTVTWAGSTIIALNRAAIFSAPTYSAGSATTMSVAATVSIEGSPIAAGSMSITTSYALRVTSGLSLFGGKIFLTGTTTLAALNLLGAITDPSSPAEGDIAYNTSSHIAKFYNGTSWVSMSGAVGGSWLLASGGTLTGTNTIQSNAVNQLQFNGTFTAGANTDFLINFSGTFTAAINSGVKVVFINPTLNGSGTSSVQIAVDISPIFAGGTTPVNIALRTQSGAVVFGNTGPQANTNVTINTNGFTQALSIQSSGTEVLVLGANIVHTAALSTSAGTAYSLTLSGSNNAALNQTGFNIVGSQTQGSSWTGSVYMFWINSTLNTNAAANGTFTGFFYNPVVTQIGTSLHFAFASTSGVTFLAASGADVVTASTRLDVRGTGTTTGFGLRLASSANTATFTVADNGVVIHTQASQASTNTFAKFTQAAHTGGTASGFLWTGGASTGQTATVESIDVNYNLARTVQFATGAIGTQRAFLVQAPTYGFVGASTITTAATFAITGNPILGTNATFTNPAALWIQSGSVLIGSTSYFLNAGNDILDIRRDQNNSSLVIVGNATSGTIANAGIGVTASSTAATTVFLRVFSAGFTSTGITIANTACVQSSMASGLNIGTTNGAALGLWTNNIQRQTIDSAGVVTFSGKVKLTQTTTTAPVNLGGFTSDASVPIEGDLGYNTTSHIANFYNGTTWISMGGGGGDMLLGTIQTVTAAKNFNQSTLALWNPAGTFKYIFTTTAIITADKTVTLPLLTGSDVFVFEAQAQSLTNKKLGSLTSNGFVKTSASDGTLSVDTSTYLTANQSITLSGDVSGSGATTITTTIGVNKVTIAMMAQIATSSFLGRTTASTGNVEVLTVTQATAMLNNFTSTLAGLAPLSGGGTINFLRADGTWVSPVAGSANEVQINNASGGFNSDSQFVYSPTTHKLTIGNSAASIVNYDAGSVFRNVGAVGVTGVMQFGNGKGGLTFDSSTGAYLYTNMPTSLGGLASTAIAAVPKTGQAVLFDHFVDAGTPATAVETDLYSDTIPAAQLSSDGDKIYAVYTVVRTGVGGTGKRVKIYFGGTAIYDDGNPTSGATVQYIIEVMIIRDSSTTIRYWTRLTSGTPASVPNSAVYSTLTGLTLSGTNIMKITGTATSAGANDVKAQTGSIKWESAATATFKTLTMAP